MTALKGLVVAVTPTAFQMVTAVQIYLQHNTVSVNQSTSLCIMFSLLLDPVTQCIYRLLDVFVCIPILGECEHGSVRLVGGATNSTGRLEVCALGRWGRVCNAFGYWGPNNARVVCRQLKFSENGKNHNKCRLILALPSL